MAISTVSLRNEIEYLRDRIRKASSSAEARHYEEKLYRLEYEMRGSRYDINTDSYVDAFRYMAPVNTMPVPEPQTPLSFLKNADNKLLLTGATL
jgi:hypothetical protein